MPRLPGDSPLLYPDNTGEYMEEEVKRGKGTCSACLAHEEDDERYDEKEKMVLWRFVVGKWGTAESANTICIPCLKKEDD
jgi:hypothetical protein